MNAFCLRKKCGTAFPQVPAQLNHCMLTNLGPTCPMSGEHNCDERHKWKFYTFGTLDYQSKKLKTKNFHLLRFIGLLFLANLTLGFLKFEFWKFHTSRNCVREMSRLLLFRMKII